MPKTEINRSVSTEAAIRNFRRSLHERVRSYQDGIREAHKGFRQRVAKIRLTADGLNLLAAGGFKDVDGCEPSLSQFDSDGEHTVVTKKKDLPTIHQLIGRLKATGRKSLVEKAHNKIWVYVSSVEFPGIEFKYQTKLPTGAKCKIVKQRQTSSTRRLVCEC